MSYILMYLGAVVVANLIIAKVGPNAAIPVAFALIGLDLTSRDHLHDAWRGRNLWPKMAALIASGSVLSWLLNRNAGPVALASFVAFALAGIADAITYHALGSKVRLLRVNGSNIIAALIDSLVFPTLAFGGLLPWIVLGQFVAKVGGGFIWSLILHRKCQIGLGLPDEEMERAPQEAEQLRLALDEQSEQLIEITRRDARTCTRLAQAEARVRSLEAALREILDEAEGDFDRDVILTAARGMLGDAVTVKSDRLQQAIDVGMVQVDEAMGHATILAPPNVNELTDDDWLDILQAATEVGRELEALGYEVTW